MRRTTLALFALLISLLVLASISARGVPDPYADRVARHIVVTNAADALGAPDNRYAGVTSLLLLDMGYTEEGQSSALLHYPTDDQDAELRVTYLDGSSQVIKTVLVSVPAGATIGQPRTQPIIWASWWSPWRSIQIEMVTGVFRLDAVEIQANAVGRN